MLEKRLCRRVKTRLSTTFILSFLEFLARECLITVRLPWSQVVPWANWRWALPLWSANRSERHHIWMMSRLIWAGERRGISPVCAGIFSVHGVSPLMLGSSTRSSSIWGPEHPRWGLSGHTGERNLEEWEPIFCSEHLLSEPLLLGGFRSFWRRAYARTTTRKKYFS